MKIVVIEYWSHDAGAWKSGQAPNHFYYVKPEDRNPEVNVSNVRASDLFHTRIGGWYTQTILLESTHKYFMHPRAVLFAKAKLHLEHIGIRKT